MATSTLIAQSSVNGHTVRCLVEQHREVIQVDTLLDALDPRWEQVDLAGHFHAVDHELRLPTLRWVPEPCTMGHDNCDAEGRYECRACGEVLVPGRRPSRPEHIAGEVRWEVVLLDAPPFAQGATVSFRTTQTSVELFGLLVVSHVETTHALEQTTTRTFLWGQLHVRAAT